MPDANLTWLAAPGAVYYDVEYKLASSSTWTVFASPFYGTSCSILGLPFNTTYDFKVKTICEENESIPTIVTVTTPCDEIAVISSSITYNSTTNTVTAQINPTWGSFIKIDVFYKKTSDTTYVYSYTETISGTAIILSDLDPCDSYDVELIGYCSEDNVTNPYYYTFSTNASGTPCNNEFTFEINNTFDTASIDLIYDNMGMFINLAPPVAVISLATYPNIPLPDWPNLTLGIRFDITSTSGDFYHLEIIRNSIIEYSGTSTFYPNGIGYTILGSLTSPIQGGDIIQLKLVTP